MLKGTFSAIFAEPCEEKRWWSEDGEVRLGTRTPVLMSRTRASLLPRNGNDPRGGSHHSTTTVSANFVLL